MIKVGKGKAAFVAMGAMASLLAGAATSVMAATLPAGYPASSTVVVAPGGADTASGSLTAPVASIARALALAKPGGHILIRGGSYPELRDSIARTGSVVTVEPFPSEVVSIAGAKLTGAQGLSFRGLRFTTSVYITNHSSLKALQPAQRISIRESDLTTGDFAVSTRTKCIWLRGGSSQIRIERNRIHHCPTGIAGVVRDARSSNIVISKNQMDHFSPDAIQFGSWQDVEISDNTISEMQDGGVDAHTDGIQFTGDIDRVRILRNLIHDSRNGQLMLLQDQYGPINDVVVENNALIGAAGIAIQVQGVTGYKMVNNTVWNGRWGGLLVRRGPGTGTLPLDSVLVNNVIDRLSFADGARPALQQYNLIGTTASPLGLGDRVGVDPGFASDWTPKPGSVLLAAGQSALSPAVDLLGMTRPSRPSIGAYEGSSLVAGVPVAEAGIPGTTAPAPMATSPATPGAEPVVADPAVEPEDGDELSTVDDVPGSGAVEDSKPASPIAAPVVPRAAPSPRVGSQQPAPSRTSPPLVIEARSLRGGTRLRLSCSVACRLVVRQAGQSRSVRLDGGKSEEVRLSSTKSRVSLSGFDASGGQSWKLALKNRRWAPLTSSRRAAIAGAIQLRYR